MTLLPAPHLWKIWSSCPRKLHRAENRIFLHQQVQSLKILNYICHVMLSTLRPACGLFTPHNSELLRRTMRHSKGHSNQKAFELTANLLCGSYAAVLPPPSHIVHGKTTLKSVRFYKIWFQLFSLFFEVRSLRLLHNEMSVDWFFRVQSEGE